MPDAASEGPVARLSPRRRQGLPCGGRSAAPAAAPASRRTADDPAARRARTIRALAVLALAALLHQAGAHGARAEPSPQRGAALYAQHCAACHGAEARGDGPLSPALNPQPTNLRALGRGAAFPAFRVAARIDGREPLVAHGSPMPIWGGFLDGPRAVLRSPAGQTMPAPAPVADLVAFLATIQD